MATDSELLVRSDNATVRMPLKHRASVNDSAGRSKRGADIPHDLAHSNKRSHWRKVRLAFEFTRRVRTAEYERRTQTIG